MTHSFVHHFRRRQSPESDTNLVPYNWGGREPPLHCSHKPRRQKRTQRHAENMRLHPKIVVAFAMAIAACDGFAPPTLPASGRLAPGAPSPTRVLSTAQEEEISETSGGGGDAARQIQKRALLSLLGGGGGGGGGEAASPMDPVLADPATKEPLRISRRGSTALLGGAGVGSGSGSGSRSGLGTALTLRSSPDSDAVYAGRTDTYLNLLEPEAADGGGDGGAASALIGSLSVLVPPPLRAALASTGLTGDYVPMRDLFTSPSVSFAYERGWRQGFAGAGFPGPDREAELAMEYFEPAVVGSGPSTVVDMSCATGLFTRRLAKSGGYDRVLGCDYSDSMLSEARRRINADADLSGPSSSGTRLDLVRCDVGNLPMRTDSVSALNAGAAMHCWPDLDAALSEIHRALKPGGRYFATTFLSSYFNILQSTEQGREIEQNMQAFQYFESTDVLRDMVIKAGFDEDKVSVEVLGTSCAVIRAEK